MNLKSQKAESDKQELQETEKLKFLTELSSRTTLKTKSFKEKLWKKKKQIIKGFNLASSVKYTESFVTAIPRIFKGFSEIYSRLLKIKIVQINYAKYFGKEKNK